MKVLMKKIAGGKRARMWNMAAFQTRRWHREQEALKAAANVSDPLIRKNPADSVQPGSADAVSSVEQPLAATTESPMPENQLRQTRRWHREQEALAAQAPNPQTEPAEPGHPRVETVANSPTSFVKSQPPADVNVTPSSASADPMREPSAGKALGLTCDNENSGISSPPCLPLLPSANLRARVGKIARLPHDARETVNSMLRGGFRYKDISAHLEHCGYSGITENNISFWKYHGYMDWLARQHELEARAHLVKSFEHCTRALDTDRVQQNAIAFAAEQLSQVMALYDHRNILNLLNERPELFPKFVQAMATLSRCSNDLAKSFAANQASDGLIRAEMKANPITTSLSEPISEADLDGEDEPATSAGVTDSVHHPSPNTPVSGGHITPSSQHPRVGSEPPGGQPEANGNCPSIGRPAPNGVCGATSEPSLGNSKQFQATTTIAARSSIPTTAETHSSRNQPLTPRP